LIIEGIRRPTCFVFFCFHVLFLCFTFESLKTRQFQFKSPVLIKVPGTLEMRAGGSIVANKDFFHHSNKPSSTRPMGFDFATSFSTLSVCQTSGLLRPRIDLEDFFSTTREFGPRSLQQNRAPTPRGNNLIFLTLLSPVKWRHWTSRAFSPAEFLPVKNQNPSRHGRG